MIGRRGREGIKKRRREEDDGRPSNVGMECVAVQLMC